MQANEIQTPSTQTKVINSMVLQDLFARENQDRFEPPEQWREEVKSQPEVKKENIESK
jgi:hypothetical protein